MESNKKFKVRKRVFKRATELLQKFKKGAKEDTEEESENQLLQARVEIVDERRSQLRSTSGETNVLPRVSREEQKKKKSWKIQRNICPEAKGWFPRLFNKKEKSKKRKEKLLQPAKGESLSRLF